MLDAELDQLLDGHRAFQQRMFGVDAQVNESGGFAHARDPSEVLRLAKGRGFIRQSAKLLP